MNETCCELVILSKGMLYSAQKRWLMASLLFALAGMFRSNGVLLGGFLIWGMLVEPIITRRPVCVDTTIFSASHTP